MIITIILTIINTTGYIWLKDKPIGIPHNRLIQQVVLGTIEKHPELTCVRLGDDFDADYDVDLIDWGMLQVDWKWGCESMWSMWWFNKQEEMFNETK